MQVSRFALLVFACILPSCGTATGHELVASVTKQMGSYSQMLGASRQKIDSVLSSLDGVQRASATDPVPAFATFTTGAKELGSEFSKLRDGVTGIQQGMKSYLDSWGHEIGEMQNPQIKAQSETRKGQIAGLFTALSNSMEGGVKSSDGFLAHLGDVQKLLNNDLNQVGIAKAKSVLASLRTEGSALMARFGEIATQADHFAKDLAPAAK